MQFHYEIDVDLMAQSNLIYQTLKIERVCVAWHSLCPVSWQVHLIHCNLNVIEIDAFNSWTLNSFYSTWISILQKCTNDDKSLEKSRQHLITFSAFVCNFKWCALLNTFYSKKWNSISIQSKYLDEFHVYSTNKDQHDEREKITKTISFWWKKNEGHLNLWKGMTKQTTNGKKICWKKWFYLNHGWN